MRLTLLALLVPSLAAATPRTTFDRATTFQSCRDITMFACGMRDAAGHTFGTAETHQACSRYTFRTDGSFTATDFFAPVEGRYRIVGKEVVLTFDRSDDQTRRVSLELSADGEKLGELSKIR